MGHCVYRIGIAGSTKQSCWPSSVSPHCGEIGLHLRQTAVIEAGEIDPGPQLPFLYKQSRTPMHYAVALHWTQDKYAPARRWWSRSGSVKQEKDGVLLWSSLYVYAWPQVGRRWGLLWWADSSLYRPEYSGGRRSPRHKHGTKNCGEISPERRQRIRNPR